jgi:hypothetical protein
MGQINIYPKLLIAFLLLTLMNSSCEQTQGPTSTAMPTITPITGWHKVSNEGFEMWLPESYIGGTSIEFDTLSQQLMKFGPEYAGMATAVKANASSMFAFAIDKTKGKSGSVTNIIVINEITSDGLLVEKYIDNLAGKLPTQYKVITKDSLATTRYPTGILILETSNQQTGNIKQIMYAIKSGRSFWQIAFTTSASEFQERLPMFEQIARSITVPYMSDEAPQQGNPIMVGIGFGLIVISLLLSAWQKRQKKKKEEKLAAVQNLSNKVTKQPRSSSSKPRN